MAGLISGLYPTAAEMCRRQELKGLATRSAIKSPFWQLLCHVMWVQCRADFVDRNYRCNLSAERTTLGLEIQDVWWRLVVSNGKLALRPARLRKQPAKAKPCKDTKPAPRVTGRRGRDNVCTDEPAIGFRNDASLDACADNAVRGVDSIDGHLSDNGNGNGNGNGIGDDP
ncbi:hypothetical protein FOXG_14252 [Fusarium oxysporum f. sp. lycopersici 4287]|uniref:Uncharacterized protein n=2 Tax=Fusarium oxysporum TaxID=5507 RepID=A0A0J9VY62_FUSO4|nr:hypothetical protein FOXG_14252 [Fusarium oxysporum f. sp. lycopersici 4287]KNB15929.1 hypothetical protein FOXG_14252 [Fusarium oxysporum f. sp. lycopersici 4287]